MEAVTFHDRNAASFSIQLPPKFEKPLAEALLQHFHGASYVGPHRIALPWKDYFRVIGRINAFPGVKPMPLPPASLKPHMAAIQGTAAASAPHHSNTPKHQGPPAAAATAVKPFTSPGLRGSTGAASAAGLPSTSGPPPPPPPQVKVEGHATHRSRAPLPASASASASASVPTGPTPQPPPRPPVRAATKAPLLPPEALRINRSIWQSLMPFQQFGVRFIATRKRVLLADEMG